MKIKSRVLILLAAFGACLLAASPVLSAGVPRMSVEELNDILGNENVSVLDVRAGRDWLSSEFKIRGAERAEPGDFTTWMNKYPKDSTLVLYCA